MALITVNSSMRLSNAPHRDSDIPGAMQDDQTTSRSPDSLNIALTTTEAAISFGSLTTPRWCRVKNTSEYTPISVGIKPASTYYEVMRLKAGQYNVLRLGNSTSLYAKALYSTLAFSENATNDYTFDLTGFGYIVSSIPYEKAATTGNTMTDTGASNQIAANTWGIFIVQVDADGTITTKPPDAGTPQTYADEETAIAAKPAVDTGNTEVCYITIQAPVGTAWIPGTDDFTAASDVQAINKYYTAVNTATVHAKAYEE